MAHSKSAIANETSSLRNLKNGWRTTPFAVLSSTKNGRRRSQCSSRLGIDPQSIFDVKLESLSIDVITEFESPRGVMLQCAETPHSLFRKNRRREDLRGERYIWDAKCGNRPFLWTVRSRAQGRFWKKTKSSGGSLLSRGSRKSRIGQILAEQELFFRKSWNRKSPLSPISNTTRLSPALSSASASSLGEKLTEEK